MNTRREFFIFLGPVIAVLAGEQAFAMPMLLESDPAAKRLGYKSQTDSAKRCGTCQHFQGKKYDGIGGCPLFPGKAVNTNAVCNEYADRTK